MRMPPIGGILRPTASRPSSSAPRRAPTPRQFRDHRPRERQEHELDRPQMHHKSENTTRRYIRPATVFQNNGAVGLV